MANEYQGLGGRPLESAEEVKSAMVGITDAARVLNRTLREAGEYVADWGTQFRSIATSANKVAEIQNRAQKSSKAAADALKEQNKQLAIVRTLNVQIDNLYKAAAISTGATRTALQRQADNLTRARDNAQQLANDFQSIAKSATSLNTSTAFFTTLSDVSKDIPGLRKLAGPLEAAAEAARKQTLENAKTKNLREGINKLSEEELKTGKGLTKARLEQLGLAEVAGNKTGTAAASALRTAQSTAKTQSAGLAGLTTGFKGLGSIISKAFGPIGIIFTVVEAIKTLVEAMFEADEKVTSIARNLAISKDSARDVYHRFQEINKNIDQTYAKIPETFTLLDKEVVAAGLKINELFGTTVDFTIALGEKGKYMVEQFAYLTKALNLSESEQKGLLSLTVQTGQQEQKISTSVLGIAKMYKLRTGYQVSERKILSDVLSTTNAVKLSIKGGSDALIKATVNAQHLGISLNKLDQIASSLLDFESSIQSQMEAELLTGRQLNLDKARLAALTGDQATFTEEINRLVKEAGPDFQKNRLAQEAVAKTLGISRDELADMITQQNILNGTRSAYLNLSEKEKENIIKTTGLSESVAKQLRSGTLNGAELYKVLQKAGYSTNKMVELFGEQTEQALASRTAQEKFNDSLEKAKETFTRFIDGKYLDKLADMLSSVVTVFSKHGVGGLFSFFGESELDKERKKKEVERATTTVKQYEGLPSLTPDQQQELREAKSILQANAEEANKAALVGVKDFVIKSLPEDSIVAAGGTRLGRTDEMVTLLMEQNRYLAALVAKDTTIHIDGQRVANVVARNAITTPGNLLNPGSRTYA